MTDHGNASPVPSGTSAPRGASPDPWDPSAPRNAFERATREYSDFRPSFPDSSVRAALQLDSPQDTPRLALEVVEQTGGHGQRNHARPGGSARRALEVVDIGAGTGKFTAKLLEFGTSVVAVEPAAAMREQLADLAANPRCEVVDGTAEATGLENHSADVVTYAQSWHWLDGQAALSEARRILRPGGHVAIVFNQMDVSVPWVHRLTRIMRSGDIHTPSRIPDTGRAWTKPVLFKTDFTSTLKPAQVMGLARTRSSYLKSTAANRAKMQENLRWYLHDHLGYGEDDDVEIPYYTLVWITRPL
ncbi:MAG: class I SAM-dependent methyltransferase [Actinomycetaceae bacterium]|nr:class I SAM-dependent methyltransferase [Actinomycetaceae bacterium]